MRHLPKIILALTVMATGALLSLDAGAYTYWSGANNCNQCHDGFDGTSADLHQSHVAMTSCSTCHDSNGDNPALERCDSCHGPYRLQVRHLFNGAGPDGNGLACNDCHTITANDEWNWSFTKKSFH